MKETRVKKFDMYWLIDTDLNPVHMIDDRSQWPDRDYANGNYFSTKEDAETMARKLRAVLKGADVIEMPSEKDAKIEHERQLERFVFCGEEEEIEGLEYIYISGFADCLEWLKSKIVG